MREYKTHTHARTHIYEIVLLLPTNAACIETSKSTLSYSLQINSIMLPYVEHTIIRHIEAVSFVSICVSWNLCEPIISLCSYQASLSVKSIRLALSIHFDKREEEKKSFQSISTRNKANLFSIQTKWIEEMGLIAIKNDIAGYTY